MTWPPSRTSAPPALSWSRPSATQAAFSLQHNCHCSGDGDGDVDDDVDVDGDGDGDNDVDGDGDNDADGDVDGDVDGDEDFLVRYNSISLYGTVWMRVLPQVSLFKRSIRKVCATCWILKVHSCAFMSFLFAA